MAGQPSHADVVKQISQAWEQAQRQLADLRRQVEQTTQLAQARAQLNLYERDLERAYRDLGEAVWQQVQSGRLRLPQGMGKVQATLQEVQRKIDEENAGLKDLLAEGTEVASRLKAKGKVSPKTAVARGKGRR